LPSGYPCTPMDHGVIHQPPRSCRTRRSTDTRTAAVPPPSSPPAQGVK
jgi:hypothetical protein